MKRREGRPEQLRRRCAAKLRHKPPPPITSDTTLRNSESLGRAVFDHSPVGISVRLSSGELLYVNRAWKRIWRLSNRQITANERRCRNWPVRRRYPYLKGAAPAVTRVFRHGGRLFLPEIRVEDPKLGAARWIAQHYYAVPNDRGQVEYVVTLTQDITLQKTAALALRASEEKFRTIVQNVNLGVYRTTADIQGRFIQVNPAFARMFGYPSVREMMHTPVRKIYARAQDRVAFLKELTQHGFVRNRELLLLRKDGTSIWTSVYAKAQQGEDGRIRWIDGVIEEITERKVKEERLRAMTLIDDLTGLYNRRGFMTLAEHQLQEALRDRKSAFLLFIDLDNLKDVNDEYGHTVGDQALIQTTGILKAAFRESDTIARIGGDEFVVLSQETTGTRGQTFCDRLSRHLALFNTSGRLPFELSLSIGWAKFHPERPVAVKQLLAQADRMMYRHKHSKPKP